ncbi:MAG TPA: RsmD family RNA methyltransferase [Candidatus Saccharimonadales bacterium]|nr:RsmD family RNA methyltransferase [Candidatus Saccharimonadales bacterium]
MRIIAGRLGGRAFNSPRGNRTHPMSERIRGALFNALGDITGLTVLDAFAGSGALSFEALSRGVARATAIDSDQSAQRTIAENSKELGLTSQIKLIKASAGAWLSTTPASVTFDIVICDPPYADVTPQLLERLADRCKQDGIVVLSLPPQTDIELADNYELLSSKNYGDAELSFHRRLDGPSS